jgi:hypothetical protein
MLVVLPGSVGPRRLLVDVLREQHNDRVEAWKLDVSFREKHGIPVTPDIDWAEERRRAAAITVAVEREDPALVRLGATAALTAMSAAPQDPGEFVEPEGLGDVVVAPRFVSARKMRELRTAWGRRSLRVTARRPRQPKTPSSTPAPPHSRACSTPTRPSKRSSTKRSALRA